MANQFIDWEEYEKLNKNWKQEDKYWKTLSWTVLLVIRKSKLKIYKIKISF